MKFIKDLYNCYKKKKRNDHIKESIEEDLYIATNGLEQLFYFFIYIIFISLFYFVFLLVLGNLDYSGNHLIIASFMSLIFGFSSFLVGRDFDNVYLESLGLSLFMIFITMFYILIL